MAVDLTLRLVKGSELTFAEIDNNWQLLDHAIDSLDAKVDSMTLGGLADVDTRFVTKDDYLQWNGSKWVPEPVILPRTTDFQGTIDVTTDSAPTDRAAGDAYLNLGSGFADSSWYGLIGPIDSSALIVWSSDQGQWYSWGGELPGVVAVRPGSGISIDNIDPKQPIVNNLCDSAYIESQLDSLNTILQNNIDSVNDALNNLTAIVNANFDSIDGSIGTINNNISNINNDITDINNEIIDINNELGGINIVAYTAGNGLQLIGPQFSMTGSFNGSFTASGDIVAYSDAALKSNITPIDDALGRISQISGYIYDKEGEVEKRTGVIAQEIERVLPEAVHKNSDGILGVAYGNLTGLLIEAMKELTSKVEELESRLSEK